MAIKWSDNMSYEGKGNNFERDYFEVLQNVLDPDTGEIIKKGLVNVSDRKMPEMFIAMCGETQKIYLYNKSNDVDPVLGKWREVGSAELGGILNFNTIAVMALFTPKSKAALAYCAEDEKTYLYLVSNESDPTTGKWRVFVTGSVNKEMVRCIAVDTIDPSSPPTGYDNGNYLYDCTNDKVYLYNVTWIEDTPAAGHDEYSFEEVTDVPSGTTPTEVEDITQISATESTVGVYYHDTTTDKYYIGIKTWVEDTPATGHDEYSVTDVTDNVTMFECTITESLYESLDNAVQMRDVTWYVD